MKARVGIARRLHRAWRFSHTTASARASACGTKWLALHRPPLIALDLERNVVSPFFKGVGVSRLCTGDGKDFRHDIANHFYLPKWSWSRRLIYIPVDIRDESWLFTIFLPKIL
jgi:hypothetical protein